MSMTDAEQTKAAQIAAAADKFIQGKDGIRQKLNAYGVDTAPSVPFSAYPGRVEDLGLRTLPSPEELIVTVHLNPLGTDFYMPTDSAAREALLDGAIMRLVVGGTKTYTAPVLRLEDAVVSFRIPAPASSVECRAALFLGNDTVRAMTKTITARAGGDTDAIMLTYEASRIQRAFGRAQIFTGSSVDAATSFPIVAEFYNGEESLKFGHYDHNGNWVNTTGVKVRLGYWNETTGEHGYRVIDAQSDTSESAVPLDEFLGAFSNLRVAEMTVGNTQDVFIELPKAYTKREKRTLQVQHWDEYGAVSSTDEITYIIHWLADERPLLPSETPDTSWHLHTAFQRDIFNETSGEYETPVDLEKIYIQRYPSNSSGYSRSDGTTEVGNNQAGWRNAYRNKNALITTLDGVSYPANADARRHEICGYKQICYIQLCAYLWFGVNVQSYLQGICTATNRTSSYNGDSDVLLGGARAPEGTGFGYFFAGIATQTGEGSEAVVNYNPNNRTIVFMGFEDALWSSTGWIAGDIVAISKRDANNVLTGNYLFVRDPAYSEPAATKTIDGVSVSLTREWRLAHGYILLPCDYYNAGMNRQMAATNISERDLFVNTKDYTEENINVKGVDNFWQGNAPASAGESFYMVALGTYRYNGSHLGAFSLTAASGLGYSYGIYWRSRSTCCLVA